MDIRNVMFDITNSCNMHCRHCYKQNDIANDNLDKDTIILFLKHLSQKKMHPNIILSGGETLLYPWLKELLEYLSSNKYNVRLNTNGLLLDKFVDFFNKFDNFKIQVSLDGYNNETYKAVRNVDHFDRIAENVRYAKNKGLNVNYRATLTNITIDNYEVFFELSRSHNIPLVLRPIINTGLENQQELKIEFSRLLDWCEEIQDKDYYSWCGGKNLLSENACPLLNKEPTISILCIDHNGDIYPCSLLRGKSFLAGNIGKLSIEELDDNLHKSVQAVKDIINCEQCIKCGFRNRIGDGTCIASCYFGNKTCVHQKIYSEV